MSKNFVIDDVDFLNEEVKVVSNPFSGDDGYSMASRYTEELVDKITTELLPVMRNLHGFDYSNVFWRLVLRRTLILIVCSLYTKYKYIKQAYFEHPNLKAFFKIKKNNFVFHDIDSLRMDTHCSNSYNEYQYLEIIRALGLSYIKEDYEYNDLDTIDSKQKKPIFFRVKKLLTIKIPEMISKIRRPVILCSSYFPRIVDLFFMIITFGKIVPYNYFEYNKLELNQSYEIDRITRDTIANIKIDSSEFSSILMSFLSKTLPLCYIEQFDECMRQVSTIPINNPKAIFSSNLYEHAALFIFYSACCYDKGTKVLAGQHGGFGVYERNAFDYDYNPLFKYYSWGESVFNKENIRCLGVIKHVSVFAKKSRFDNNKEILYGTIHAKDPFCFEILFREPTLDQNDFDKRMANFLANINNVFYERTTIRVKKVEGSDYSGYQELIENFPGVSLQIKSSNFVKQLFKSRVYVCDHLETSYIEALYLNIPTIIFYKEGMYRFTEKGQDCINALKEVGVIHSSPESAANMLNKVYENIEDWWMSREVQQAREYFCQHFAKNSSFFTWLKEFRKYL